MLETTHLKRDNNNNRRSKQNSLGGSHIFSTHNLIRPINCARQIDSKHERGYSRKQFNFRAEGGSSQVFAGTGSQNLQNNLTSLPKSPVIMGSALENAVEMTINPSQKCSHSKFA